MSKNRNLRIRDLSVRAQDSHQRGNDASHMSSTLMTAQGLPSIGTPSIGSPSIGTKYLNRTIGSNNHLSSDSEHGES